ncbi:S1 family peptidase [Saccharobesus litoralis]|nr:serine protease [Saccharobesus litoralis]
MDIKLRSFLVALLVVLLASCANTQRTTGQKKYKIAKDVSIPNATQIAVYLPEKTANSKFWVNATNNWHEPGKAFKESIEKALGKYFTNVVWFDQASDTKPNVYMSLSPDWDYNSGKIEMDMQYKIFDSSGKVLVDNKYETSSGLNFHAPDAAYYNSSYQAVEKLAVNFLNKLKPNVTQFPANLAMNQFALEKFVNIKKPVSSGTGFFLNPQGVVLTANHVIDDCLLIKVKQGELLTDATLSHSSQLLDVAVLNTNHEIDTYLKLRDKNELTLGEKLTTVSYPLKGLLESSPNMTFGNVTSKKALTGSLGLYQFSAPIQPGSSGGAIVSEQSELIGMVTSTLNVTNLAKKGVIPQNVNFALDVKYLRKFLDKNQVGYETSAEQSAANFSESALGTAVQIACYQ